MAKSAVKKESKLSVKDDLFDILRAILISTIFSIVAILIFTIIVQFSQINENGIMIGNIIIKTLSVLVGCIFGIRNGKGILKGLISGLLFLVLTWLIFSAINGGFVAGAFSWIDALCGIAVGAISGVIAVNIRRKK